MDFYLADALTTFLAIILFTVVFFVFSRRELREKFFNLWTLGWGFILLQYLSQVAILADPVRSPGVVFLDRLLLASAAIVFLLSARTFAGLRTSWILIAGLGLLLTGSSYVQIYYFAASPSSQSGSDASAKLTNLLVSYHFSWFSLMLGILVIFTGMAFFRSRERSHSVGVQILAYGFLVEGIGLMSLGLVLRWTYFIPLAVQFLDVPRLVIAFGMLIYLFEREKIAMQKHRDEAVGQREFIQSLMDNANDSIFATDREGGIQWINKQGERVLGQTSENLKGKSYREFLRREDRDRVKHATALALQGQPQSLEIKIATPREKYRSMQISMSRVLAGQQEIAGVLIVGRDVTEMKAMEQQLHHAEKLMALGQMISGAAHELNNPLTAVMGFSELSLKDEALDPKLRQRFDRILQAAARSKKIVESLQNFVRVPDHAVESVEINELVRESLGLLEPDLYACHINAKLRLARELMWVTVNRERLVQVIQNILKNAMEAISEVKNGGTITITTALEGNNTVVSITDDGPGLKDPDRVFEPFYTTKEVGKGMGMALSVGYSILQHYGGKITAENNFKGGATFRLILPTTSFSLSQKVESVLNAS